MLTRTATRIAKLHRNYSRPETRTEVSVQGEMNLNPRLADAGVDVVKIKELMGHASIVTTMRYIHATDQGKRGAIVVLSEYRQKQRHKFVTNEERQAVRPAVSHC